MNSARLEIRPGLWLDSRLALWIATPRLLVVADLHWGYAHSHRVQGNLLPAWGDATLAQRLRDLIADYRPAEMIWLGDSLHTLAGRELADAFVRTSPVPITILSGNHDARWPLAQGRDFLDREGCYLHHGDRPRTVPADRLEIVGHHHPAFVWQDGAGTRLKLPALVASAPRLVLPAFSPWAAGTPWKRQPHETVYAISPKRIFTLSPEVLQK